MEEPQQFQVPGRLHPRKLGYYRVLGLRRQLTGPGGPLPGLGGEAVQVVEEDRDHFLKITQSRRRVFVAGDIDDAASRKADISGVYFQKRRLCCVVVAGSNQTDPDARPQLFFKG